MSLSSWNKNNIFKFSIDNEHVDEILTDFPVLLNLSSTSGKNNFDCSDVFTELTEFVEERDFSTIFLLQSVDKEHQDTTFTDTSGYGHSISIGDAPVIHSTTEALFGTSSIYFENTVCYLTVVDEILFDIGTNDFTIDFHFFWFNSNSGIFSFGTYANGITMGIASSTIYVGVSDDYLTISTSVLTADTFVHIAVARKNGLVKLYIDGILKSSKTMAGSVLPSEIHIGRDIGLTNNYLYGYLEDFRVSHVARWEENFTFPTTSHTNTHNVVYKHDKKIAVVYPSVQEHWVQEYDVYTKLLIHSDTNDDDTTFIDESQFNYTLVAEGQAHHETDQKKFGSTSIYLTSSTDKITVSTIITDDFYFLGDFTIDLWVLDFSTTQSSTFLVSDGSTYLAINYCASDSEFDLFLNSSSPTITVSHNNSGSFEHIALVRNGSIISLYINGTSIWSTSNINPLGYQAVDNPTCSIKGGPKYLDEVRISKGIARWTENFTPPIAPYSKENVLKQYIHGDQEQLFCEIERWDQTNENAQLWVKVPRILSDQPTDLLLYYDNTQEDNNNYVGDTSSWPAQQVWNDAFVAVYHMSQDPSVGGACILDSTSGEHHGTPTGSMVSNDLVTGIVGKAIKFNGSTQYVSITDHPDLQLGIGDLTVLILQNTDPSDTDGNFISKYYTGFEVATYNNDIIAYIGGLSNNVEAFSGGHITDDVWSLIGVRRILNDTKGFQNSTWSTTTVTNSASASNIGTDLCIAHRPGGVSYYAGKISEVLISNVGRSNDWIAITNLSLIDNLINIHQADIYQINGYVKELGKPAERMVYLYDRASGELVDKNISNSLGYYTLNTTTSGTHNIVCLDASSAPDFNDLIISKVTPTETI